MSENLQNYKIGHEKKLFFISNERVVGTQSITTNQNFASTPLNYAGIGQKTVNYIPRGEQSNSVNINSYLINKDYFLDKVTGNSLYNCYLVKDKTDFSSHYYLTSGYFNSFEANYSVGGNAEINTIFVSVGEAGTIKNTGIFDSAQIADITFISTGNTDVNLETLLIPDIGSIQLNLDEFQTNRVLSYSIRVETNKKPIYNIGSRYPKRVENIYPINVECSFTFEPGDYESLRLRNFPQSGVVKNLTVTIDDHNNGGRICQYSFNNLNLINENQEVSVGNNVVISQVYQGQIFA